MLNRVLNQLMLIGPFWHWPAKKATSTSKLRRLARRNRFRRYPVYARLILWTGATLLWPVGILISVSRIAHLRKSRQQNGKTFPVDYRTLSAIKFALRHNVPPMDYLLYGLWDEEGHQSVDDFLYSNERLGLMLALNQPPPLKRENPIENKTALAELCETNGISHPRRFTMARSSNENRSPAMMDLWEKPATGAHGKDHILWKQIDNLYYENDRSERYPFQELVQRVSQTPSRILQEKLTNHPALHSYTNGGVCVVRYVSLLQTSGATRSIAATIQFPTGKSLLSRSGIVGRINVENGRVEDFRNVSSLYEKAEFHPDTSAPFSEFTLPHWQGLVGETARLHRLIPYYRMVGWDIVITPNGPVILEGNSSWNAQQHQESSPKPTPLLPRIFDELGSDLIDRI